MPEAPIPLTPEDLAALDAQYEPFPGFAKWPSSVPLLASWENQTGELEHHKQDADPSAVEDATGVAVRAAAWDTGAIEGLYTTNRGITMTIATQTAEWETEIAAHGAEAAALFDAQLATYELVLDVATQRQPVTEAWIRRLHEELTRPQETYTVHTPAGTRQESLPRGDYKARPNHVEQQDGSRHAYAPVADTGPEMHRLVEELSSKAFAKAHPILQASYAHYALTAIHPFADGNGRVARALASTYLYRAARIPLIVFADDRDAYLQALSDADTGAHVAFVRYAAEAAIAATEVILEALATRAVPDPDEMLDEFRTLLTVQGGLTHTDLDAIATTLLMTHFGRIVSEEIAKLRVISGVTVSMMSGTSGDQNPPNGYRQVVSARNQFVGINFQAAAPSEAAHGIEFRVFISTLGDDEDDLFWLVQLGTETGSKYALRDLHPTFKPASEHRLRFLARRVLGQELQTLYFQARESMKASGYPMQGDPI
jgi:Fic family protein